MGAPALAGEHLDATTHLETTIMSWIRMRRNQAISLALAAIAVCLTGADQTTYEEHCQQGRKHLLAGEHKEAQESYNNAAQMDRERALAHVGLALAYRAMGQLDLASDAATRAIGPGAPGKEDIAALVIRGTVLHAQKQYKSAEEDFKKALEFAPNNAIANAELGRVFVDLEEGMEARMHFSEALDADPEDHQTYVARGKLYRQEGNLGGAARDFEKACELYPQSAAYHFLLGQARFENGEYDDALKAAEKAIELNKDLSAAYVLKGAILYQQDEYKLAEESLVKAADMARMDAGAWLWLGKTRLAQDKIEQATKDIQQALDIDKRYVAAHRAMADIYDRTERSEEAAEMRTKAYGLERTLRKLAIFGPEFRNDLAPSTLGLTEGFDRTMGAAEAFDSRVPSPDVITDQVRAAAEQRRQELLPWREDVKICEAASVVPVIPGDAEEAYSRSIDLVKAKDYEVAAHGFGQALALYQTALEEFARVAGRDHELWLDWAEERAESDSSTRRRASVWLVLGEARHGTGDREGYRQAMQRAISCVRVGCTVDPVAGADAMLGISAVQLRCDDRDGAREAAREAAAFCEGIQEAGRKAFRLGRCSGVLARLGEADEWNTLMPVALNEARNVGRSSTSANARRPLLVKSVAYGEAWAYKSAFAAAESVAPADRHRYPPELAVFAAPSYASTAVAAARASGNGASEQQSIFDRSYAAACAHLSAFLRAHHPDACFARRQLVEADAHLRQFDRAWVSAVSIADPHKRSVAMMRVLIAKVQAAQWDDVLELGQHLPLEAAGMEGVRWVAEARVRTGRWDMVALKKWAEAQPNAVGRSAALAGIAAGVKGATDAGTEGDAVEAVPDGNLLSNGDNSSEQRSDDRNPEAFDQSAAAEPDWWLARSARVTEGIEDPIARAWAWLQLAKAHQQTEDVASFRDAVSAAIHCTSPTWNQVLERRGHSQRGYDGNYTWRSDHRVEEAEQARINALIRMLLAVEELQSETGDKREAFNTLLLALKCVEPMPRRGGYASPAGSQATWLARIAGRAQLRGRRDIAEIIMSGYPWSQVQAMRGTDRLLTGLAAAEANDPRQVESLAEEQQTKIGTVSERATYAAILYARLALLAARRGDKNAYRRAAMKVGGLVNASRAAASRSVLLQLAEAASALGEPDIAREYVDQSRVFGPERDAVLAMAATALLGEGRLEDARELLEGLRDEEAKVPVRYALAKAEAKRSSTELSSIFEAIGRLPSKAEKASALAGVGAALLSM